MRRVSTPTPSDLRVVALGGGTGLPTVLRGLRASLFDVTEPGETDCHTGADHVLAIRRHAPTLPIHDVLVNTAPLHPAQMERYARLKAVPVPADVLLLRALGHQVVECDLLAAGDGVRHDPEKLGRALIARLS
jgi:2-phospho-L-lactate transferase/gluconeogenesis factor (CofD/UPF0052 family)